MARVLTAREIDAALRKKGFQRKADGKHLHYFFVDVTGVKSGISTLISHGMGGSTLGSNLISQRARQLHLTKQQFLAFIDCHISEKEYQNIVEGN